MDYGELNTTELRRLLRRRGLAVPALGWSREEMLKRAEAPEVGDPGAVTLIDRHRCLITEWAMRVWSKIYNQVSCPLQDEGCGGCTDLRVVSCLVHNGHVFDVSQEVPMAKWSDVIRLVAEQKTKEAAVLLGEMAKQKLVDDRPTKTALTKIVKITLDLTTTGKTGTATEYFELREVQPAVSEFMKDLDPLQIIQKVVQTLGGNGSATTTETASTPQDEPVGSTDEVQGYFPGVEMEDAPMTPGRDATKFLKTNGSKPPEAAPPAETKPPETAPTTASKLPPEAAKAPETPFKAPEPVTTQGALKQDQTALAHVIITQGLLTISRGFGQLAEGWELLDTKLSPPQSGSTEPVETTGASNTADDSDEFFVSDEDDDGV